MLILKYFILNGDAQLSEYTLTWDDLKWCRFMVADWKDD
jgi:hypothetical protein